MTNAVVPHRMTARTTDFDEAVHQMRKAFGPVNLSPTLSDAPDLSMRGVHCAKVQSTRWTMTGISGARRDAGETAEQVYLTGFRLGGTIKMWSRWDDVDTTRPFLFPHLVDSAVERPDVVNLAVSRGVVDRYAQAATGIDDFRVRFTGTAPIDPTMDSIWRDSMVFASRTADALVDCKHTSLAETGISELVSSLILRTFPNTTLDAVSHLDALGPRSAALRRAFRHIDDHLDLPITVPEIAAAARLSTRGLYAAFQRDLGTTPMAHIRAGRLSAVRDELRRSDPAATSVEEVANKWGFLHGPRFVQRYAAAFSQTPAETLHR